MLHEPRRQRTRCLYFADVAGSRCNRRDPGSVCDAIGGFNRYHAVLGTSSACIATDPSDMAVALAAIDARVRVASKDGERMIPLIDFHLLPDDHPERETALQPGEVIVAIELPPLPVAAHSTYRKVRDRASYAFALVSVAAGMTVRDGRVVDVRIALGGLAPTPACVPSRRDAARCGGFGGCVRERRCGRTGWRDATVGHRLQDRTGPAHGGRRPGRAGGDGAMSNIQNRIIGSVRTAIAGYRGSGCPVARRIR